MTAAPGDIVLEVLRKIDREGGNPTRVAVADLLHVSRTQITNYTKGSGMSQAVRMHAWLYLEGRGE